MNKTSTLRDFEVISKLGEGSFSSVFKVRRYDDQTLYALKKVSIIFDSGEDGPDVPHGT